MSKDPVKMQTMIDKIFIAHMEMENVFRIIHEQIKNSESYEISGYIDQKLTRNDISYMANAGTIHPFVLNPRDIKIFEILMDYEDFIKDKKEKFVIITIDHKNLVFIEDLKKIKESLGEAIKAFQDLYSDEG